MYVEQIYNVQKLKINSSSGIQKTIYHNASYLLLFRKRQLLNFEISCE